MAWFSAILAIANKGLKFLNLRKEAGEKDKVRQAGRDAADVGRLREDAEALKDKQEIERETDRADPATRRDSLGKFVRRK